MFRLIVPVLLLLLATDAPAQLFGGKGLFNRKEEPLPGLTPEQIGIPTPVTGRIEAMKGMETRFELQAESKTPAAAVEFLIRTFPSAGKIVSMTAHPTKRNRAVVVYYADPNSSAEADAFSFAVRYRGGRYSSEMRYDIDLVDIKAEVSVPKEIDFGDVLIGSESVKEIVIRNLGSGEFNRQVLLSPPWYMLDPAGGKLTLRGREYKTVKIAFRPDLMGETSYFVNFSRSREGTTKLIGRGVDPFQAKAEQVTLQINEESGKREGFVELENPGDKPVRVLTRASDRLSNSLQKEYYLPPGKTTSIDLALGKTDTAPFDGMVQFYLENGYTKTIQVVAPVVPGRLELTIPDSITNEVINFGQVTAGRSTERTITLTNPGGVAVPLEFHVPEPFRLLTDPGPQLGSMNAVDLSIGLYPSVAAKGPIDVTMNIYGNDQTVPLRLLGNILRSKNAPAPSAGNLPPSGLVLKGLRMGAAPRSADTPPETETAEAAETGVSIGSGENAAPSDLGVGAGGTNFVVNPQQEGAWYDGMNEEMRRVLKSPLGHITMPTVARQPNPEIRKPEDVLVLESGSNEIELAWTAPKNSDLYRFDVEIAGLHSGDGFSEPFRVWLPHDEVKFERIDRLVKAKVGGLLPNTTYEFRVFTIDETGRSSVPAALYAATGLPMDWTYIYLFSAIILVALLIYSGIRLFRERRGEVYQAQYVED